MIRTIGVRAFLRGGYSNKEPILVMRHAQPLGLWVPFDDDGFPVRDPRAVLSEPISGQPSAVESEDDR